MFISSARVYASGIGAIPQLLINIIDGLGQRYYSILFLAFNVPLFIIF
jgi:uncharacterized membrane-anchored protein YitT (DUF2179 family)